MSLLGVTKGTELEKLVDKYLAIETQAVQTYHALAYLAQEKGYTDVAETLEIIAADEARHSGLYSLLNGNVQEDIFGILSFVVNLEKESMVDIKELSKKAQALGLAQAAQEIEAVANDEGHHSELLQTLLKKYAKTNA